MSEYKKQKKIEYNNKEENGGECGGKEMALLIDHADK